MNNKRRNQCEMFRVTEKERERIQAMVDAKGVSKAAFYRMLVLAELKKFEE